MSRRAPKVIKQHVAAGDGHSLIVTEPGELLAFGQNSHGQIGDDSLVDRPRPVAIPFDARVVAVACGRRHSLCVTEDGALYAWGSNEDMFLGTGVRDKQLTPQMLIGSGIKAVAGGESHSLALTEGGQLLAWGSNKYGQLGTGGASSSSRPVCIMEDVKAMSAGYYHSIALTRSGDVYTWGFNVQGPDGRIGTREPSRILRGHVHHVAAGGNHNLALTERGDLLAWGGNEQGQVGDGKRATRRLQPVVVLRDVCRMDAGRTHSMAVTVMNDCFLWGFFISGVKTDQEKRWGARTRPAMIEIESGCWSVAAGGGHSLAVNAQGQVWTWGINVDGERAAPWMVHQAPRVETKTKEDIQRERIEKAGGVYLPQMPARQPAAAAAAAAAPPALPSLLDAPAEEASSEPGTPPLPPEREEEAPGPSGLGEDGGGLPGGAPQQNASVAAQQASFNGSFMKLFGGSSGDDTAGSPAAHLPSEEAALPPPPPPPRPYRPRVVQAVEPLVHPLRPKDARPGLSQLQLIMNNGRQVAPRPGARSFSMRNL